MKGIVYYSILLVVFLLPLLAFMTYNSLEDVSEHSYVFEYTQNFVFLIWPLLCSGVAIYIDGIRGIIDYTLVANLIFYYYPGIRCSITDCGPAFGFAYLFIFPFYWGMNIALVAYKLYGKTH